MTARHRLIASCALLAAAVAALAIAPPSPRSACAAGALALAAVLIAPLDPP